MYFQRNKFIYITKVHDARVTLQNITTLHL